MEHDFQGDEAQDGDGPVLDPIEQESIAFHNTEIIAVRLADGQIAVVLRWVCASLGLQPGGQVRRIRRTATLVEDLVRVRVQTKGGKQSMPALTLRGFAPWILTISPSEIFADDPEEQERRRALVVAYQTEAKDVLYEHFIAKSRRTALPEPNVTQTIVIPAEVQEIVQVPPTMPQPPAQDAPHSIWIQYHQEMIRWHEWSQALERWRGDVDVWRGEMRQWQGQIESRMESMEEVVRSVLSKLGLSVEHQSSVRAAIEQIWKLDGTPRQALYYQLDQAFQVAKYADIPDERWPEVFRWLKQHLDQAKAQNRDSGQQ